MSHLYELGVGNNYWVQFLLYLGAEAIQQKKIMGLDVRKSQMTACPAEFDALGIEMSVEHFSQVINFVQFVDEKPI